MLLTAGSFWPDRLTGFFFKLVSPHQGGNNCVSYFRFELLKAAHASFQKTLTWAGVVWNGPARLQPRAEGADCCQTVDEGARGANAIESREHRRGKGPIIQT